MDAKTKRDFEVAKTSLNSENYEWACFQAQQSAEKALKSLYIKKYRELIRTHDLVLLARRVSAPEKIIVFCSQINPSYIDTRYPDLEKNYSKRDAERILKFTEEVLEWIKENL